MDTVTLSIGELRNLVQGALRRGGVSEQNAAPIAETMVVCERDGVRSHGLLRLPGFIRSVQTGWADGRVQPRTLETTASLCVVDAGNGFAQVCLSHVRDGLMQMARTAGVAVLLTRNSHHFAALWPDVEPFAEQGLIALTCVNSKKRMAAWGGARPITGTNAVAFACPRGAQPPMVWDQSSSVMSQGDLLLAAREGSAVPLGVGCDANGDPTTDPSAILNGGAILPFGGHKGASIAVMVEILAAALTGSPFGFEDTSPSAAGTTSKGGQFILLIDPQRGHPRFDARVNELMTAIVGAGAERLPGDRRYRHRQTAIRDGISLARSEFESLVRLAGDASG